MQVNQNQAQDTQSADSRLLRASDLARMLSLSVRTIWRLRDAGELPHPIRVSRNLLRWRAGDVQEYLRRCMNET